MVWRVFIYTLIVLSFDVCSRRLSATRIEVEISLKHVFYCIRIHGFGYSRGLSILKGELLRKIRGPKETMGKKGETES